MLSQLVKINLAFLYHRSVQTIFKKRIARIYHKSAPLRKSSSIIHANYGTGEYKKHHQQSLQNPREYWAKQAEAISWHRPWENVLDDANAPFYKWFVGAELNACFNALDRHLPARKNQAALIYDSPLTYSKASFTYGELTQQVALFAGVLKNQGVSKGDVVLIYMPMIPQAVIAMLACARIGAIHNVVFGGFAAEQLATRINHSQPKIILTASCGVEPSRIIAYHPLLNKAMELSSSKPSRVIVYQRKGILESELVPGRDLDWDDLVKKASPAPCVPVFSTDYLYMIYTSGTTGAPKAIVRDTGGYSVAAQYSINRVFNLSPGDTIFAASDVGWVVGHTFIVYGPLMSGLTTVLYEGKPTTPDAGAFWRVIGDHKVNAFFTAPTAFRTIKRDDPNRALMKKYDTSSLKSIWVAGEHADPDTINWLQESFPGVPIVDNAWQTETGWPITANPLGIETFPIKPGSSTMALPGYDLRVFSDEGQPMPPGELGHLVAKLPLPPGTFPTLFKNDAGFVQSYMEKFPGFYHTGDAGMIDPDGYVYFMTRTDDIINVSGIRLSTGAVEEVIAAHPCVAECCVVGPRDDLRGQVPVGLVVLKSNISKTEEQVVEELIENVRDKVGAMIYFKSCTVVTQLPKTRSGKILRKTIKSIADGDEYTVPGTIENETALEIVKQALHKLGFPRPKESL